ncbi:membrane metalloendopeptidase protein [Corynebacterium pilosum]|uniref:Membrane metalloendopeptidase protein n=2 Tax=Corynebacterium pilosum TaxID=35756 RepID=A0A376CIM4_9CORY|nr:membrane metalloendopeptidase protein [Corynebacterium pilosum]
MRGFLSRALATSHSDTQKTLGPLLEVAPQKSWSFAARSQPGQKVLDTLLSLSVNPLDAFAKRTRLLYPQAPSYPQVFASASARSLASCHDQAMNLTRSSLSALLLCALLSPALAWAYVDPTTGAPSATRVLRGPDIPEQNWLPGHRGVDLALGIGDDVLAAEDGTVAFAGMVAGTPVISIDHDDGIRTTYQPVHALVDEGERVTSGTVIGRLGHPTDGYPGLHWGALIAKDTYINPLSLLDDPMIRLKPVDAPARRPL